MEKEFMTQPSISNKTLFEDRGMLLDIQDIIQRSLRAYPDFQVLKFREIDDGIVIEGYRDKVPSIPYIKVTIKKDYSNLNEAIYQFIDNWKNIDNK